MQSLEDLKLQFYNDVNSISLTFIKHYSLKFKQQEKHLSDPLFRWQDFALRYISPKPRKVFFSKEIITKLSLPTNENILKIIFMISNGEDINACQGKGLIIHNDISGKKKDKRTDLLWAEWKIHHLHIELEKENIYNYFTRRSDWLIFLMVIDDFVFLIDIKTHKEKLIFSNVDLLSIIYSNWPFLMEPFELKGVLPVCNKYNPTNKEVQELRKFGITSSYTFDNKTYVGPNMGLTSAATPLKLTTTTNKIRRIVSSLAESVFKSEKSEYFPSEVNEPEYTLSLTPRGLSIYELKQDKAFLLPRKSINSKDNDLVFLNNQLAPEWAIKSLIKE